MTTRWARFARGWTAAFVSVFIALCSHALAGGTVPSAAGMALCLAFAGMICVPLAGKTLSLFRLSVSVVVSQFLFHGGFSLLGAAGPATQARSMGAHIHLHRLNLQAADSGMTMPTWMWAAHAIAAVTTILALRFGERAFWRALALALPFLLVLLGWVAEPGTRAVGPITCDRELLPRRLAVVSMLSLRGPPVSPA